MEKVLEIKREFDDYKVMLEKGIEQRENIDDAVRRIAEDGVDNVLLVGCGGSLAVMYPLKYIMQLNSKVPVYEFNAGEFNAMKPKVLTDKSLLLVSSYTGTTRETVEAVRIAKETGAKVIGFTAKKDSPLAQLSDYIFTNDGQVGVTDSKVIMLYQIIFSLLKYVDGYDAYDEMMAALATMPENMVRIKEKAQTMAADFAAQYHDEEFFMTLGAGACWGEAYSYAICILEEMQWMKAQPVHAGEFFHGPFEIATDESPCLLIFKGEDLSRPTVDRVTDFVEKYSKKINVIDTKDYELEGVPEHLRGYFSPLVISAVLERVSNHMEVKRNHPLSTRRYMFKVDY